MTNHDPRPPDLPHEPPTSPPTAWAGGLPRRDVGPVSHAAEPTEPPSGPTPENPPPLPTDVARDTGPRDVTADWEVDGMSAERASAFRSPLLTRRRVLGVLGLGGAAFTGAVLLDRSSGPSPEFSSPTTTPGSPPTTVPGPQPRLGPDLVPVDQRRLVIVELSGGNDGLATLVPFGDGAYHDLRADFAPDVGSLVEIDDGHGLHPGLAPLAERGVAVLQGVGLPGPSGSHFEMEARWWAGVETAGDMPPTGVLGRLCDELDVGAPVTGVSLGGATPYINSAKSVTVGIPDPGSASFLTAADPWSVALRSGLGTMASRSATDAAFGRTARGLEAAVSFTDMFASLGEADDRIEYPEGQIAGQLRQAARLLTADVGVRVVHVKLGGFDTHADQERMHDRLMGQVGTALAAFLDDLAVRGLERTTLVATTSEFGRRPKPNGAGTDHGAGSVALLAGPIAPGLHGEASSLTVFDDDDNLATQVRSGDYFATMIESWMGVPAAAVLPEGGSPIPEMIA